MKAKGYARLMAGAFAGAGGLLLIGLGEIAAGGILLSGLLSFFIGEANGRKNG